MEGAAALLCLPHWWEPMASNPSVTSDQDRPEANQLQPPEKQEQNKQGPSVLDLWILRRLSIWRILASNRLGSPMSNSVFDACDVNIDTGRVFKEFFVLLIEP